MPRRGSTTLRGYGTVHQRERDHWRPKVDAGIVNCARCHQPLEPGRPWDLGHTDDRTGYTGPEHAVCNRRAGGANGARVTNATRQATSVHNSRDW
jgi:hypothetical protein